MSRRGSVPIENWVLEALDAIERLVGGSREDLCAHIKLLTGVSINVDSIKRYYRERKADAKYCWALVQTAQEVPPEGYDLAFATSKSVTPPAFVFKVFEKTGKPPHDERMAVHVVNDGFVVPEGFRDLYRTDHGFKERFNAALRRDREIGSRALAAEIAAALGLAGYYYSTIARPVFDTARRWGVASPDDKPLERRALRAPVSTAAVRGHLVPSLHSLYDEVSTGFEELVSSLRGGGLLLGIYTFDGTAEGNEARAQVELVNSAGRYRHLHPHRFGPLFPTELLRETCPDHVALALADGLKRAGFKVDRNTAFKLPDGSIEVRSLGWQWFEFLHKQFRTAGKERGLPDYETDLVWSALKSVNGGTVEYRVIREYLYEGRCPKGIHGAKGQAFIDVKWAVIDEVHRAIELFVKDHPGLPEVFCPWVHKSLVLEVDRSLIMKTGRTSRPRELRTEAMQAIARCLSETLADWQKVAAPRSDDAKPRKVLPVWTESNEPDAWEEAILGDTY